MKINREGFPTIFKVALPLIAILLLLNFFALRGEWSQWVMIPVNLGLLYVIISIFYFFREPHRQQLTESGAVFSPADGKVVVIEEVDEKEYFGDRRLQISVFMSVTDVHINWFPIAGRISYHRYHPGRFRVAWHPKSSEENERMSVAVKGPDGEILYRQIAGLVARRIVSYASEGKEVEQNSKCGFIKFGSRVDIFLPLDSKVEVALGDKVTGSQTILAHLP